MTNAEGFGQDLAGLASPFPDLSESARQIIQAILSGPHAHEDALDVIKAILARPALSQAQQRAILSILDI